MLLIHLWPGNWQVHLRNLNIAIEVANASRSKRGLNKKVVSFVSGESQHAWTNSLCICHSEREWWIIWGVIFVACPCHKGGNKLFETEQPPGTAAPVIDMSIDKAKFDEVNGATGKKIISWNRFKTIKEEFLWKAFDNGTNDQDPWHLISGLVDDFNANRKKWIIPEMSRVLDESMSGFQPRTAKSSILPFISYVIRKPTPLGTEYKVAACPETGIMCYLEIQ